MTSVVATFCLVGPDTLRAFEAMNEIKAPTSTSTPTGVGLLLIVGGTCAIMPVATSPTRCVVPIGYCDAIAPCCCTFCCT